MITIPALVLRKKMILRTLRENGAVSEKSAMTLKEAGVFYPSAFKRVTEDLIRQQKLGKVGSNKYYLK